MSFESWIDYKVKNLIKGMQKMNKFGEPWACVDDDYVYILDSDEDPIGECERASDGKRIIQVINASAGIDDPVVMERERFNTIEYLVMNCLSIFSDNRVPNQSDLLNIKRSLIAMQKCLESKE